MMMHVFLPVRRISALCAIFLGLACAGRSAAGVTPEQVDNAIEKAKQFIYKQQLPGGHWEPDAARTGTDHKWDGMQGDTYGGYTGLATYALLAAGESPNTPRIKAAVDFLERADMVGIYSIAMRCQVWLLIPHQSPQIKALIRRDAETLLAGVNSGTLNPANQGLWDYLGKGDRVDHSVSQYGVLGLWACQQTGVMPIARSHWKDFENAWRRDQMADGGWIYGKELPFETLSMTAAGVATLFITGDYVHADDGVGCAGSIPQPWIDKGMAWIDKNYEDVVSNEYAMYGIERIGTASGYKYFATHDWYSELAERLVKKQETDGSWINGQYPGARPLDETCFAMLFLARGRAPVLMNKLDYRPRTVSATQPSPANWDERPRDAANLATWVGHETEKFLNWQIVNLLASPNDLHDAPILYLSGNEAMTFKPDETAKIKTFVEQGGMVLGNADCGRGAFAKSFEELGESLFPAKFRELPSDHPVYTHQQFSSTRWRSRPSVLGLSNGVRELMILLPNSDPSRWWQDPSSAAGHEDAYELGTDLYQYSIDRQIWNKGASYIVVPDPSTATRKIKLARLQVGTNWNPEPGGWTRLAAILHNKEHLDLTVFNAVLGQGALAAAHIAHLTGTTDFTLSDAARLELATFVRHGGTLVIDSAGGSPAFTQAARRELNQLFGAAATTGLENPLPPDHPLYNLPGNKIATFTYRRFARLKRVGNLKQPEIRGIDIGTRTAVFFSPDDISAGMVGEPVDGIIGYSPETATELMRNIILYSDRPKTAGQSTTTRGH
jgi:hypothetical protein